MITELIFLGAAVAGLLVTAAALHLLPRLGPPGRRLALAASRAPMLDLLVIVFTVLPPVVGLGTGIAMGRTAIGVLLLAVAGMAAQYVALFLWIMAHEFRHRAETRGKTRIVTTLSGMVGPARNHVAVWWTTLAAPLFVLVRLCEVFLYPPLIWLVRFPRYRHAEWVSVSRQKFDGLVGHDLVWCLYCDWMTGVWSLGGEMLRNVESFWCPIRFGSPEKCANCSVDFPDLAGDWVPPDATVADAAAVIEAKYADTDVNSWYGHPARLTVNGKTPD